METFHPGEMSYTSACCHNHVIGLCLIQQLWGGDRGNKLFAQGKKTTAKVAKNRYFIICAKSLLENMNSNEAEKTLKEIWGKVPDAQTEAERGPKRLRQLGNYGL